MRTYALENRGRAPLYEYLYRCIRGDILDGTLTAGERLPSGGGVYIKQQVVIRRLFCRLSPPLYCRR